MAEGTNIGSAYVDITANLTPIEEAIDRLLTKLGQLTGEPHVINVTGDIKGGAGRAKGGTPGSAAQQGPPATAAQRAAGTVDLKFNAEEAVGAVQKAFNEKLFEIKIDVPHLRAQIEKAFEGIEISPSVSRETGAGGAPVNREMDAYLRSLRTDDKASTVVTQVMKDLGIDRGTARLIVNGARATTGAFDKAVTDLLAATTRFGGSSSGGAQTTGQQPITPEDMAKVLTAAERREVKRTSVRNATETTSLVDYLKQQQIRRLGPTVAANTPLSREDFLGPVPGPPPPGRRSKTPAAPAVPPALRDLENVAVVLERAGREFVKTGRFLTFDRPEDTEIRKNIRASSATGIPFRQDNLLLSGLTPGDVLAEALGPSTGQVGTEEEVKEARQRMRGNLKSEEKTRQAGKHAKDTTLVDITAGNKSAGIAASIAEGEEQQLSESGFLESLLMGQGLSKTKIKDFKRRAGKGELTLAETETTHEAKRLANEARSQAEFARIQQHSEQLNRIDADKFRPEVPVSLKKAFDELGIKEAVEALQDDLLSRPTGGFAEAGPGSFAQVVHREFEQLFAGFKDRGIPAATLTEYQKSAAYATTQRGNPTVTRTRGSGPEKTEERVSLGEEDITRRDANRGKGNRGTRAQFTDRQLSELEDTAAAIESRLKGPISSYEKRGGKLEPARDVSQSAATRDAAAMARARDAASQATAKKFGLDISARPGAPVGESPSDRFSYAMRGLDKGAQTQVEASFNRSLAGRQRNITPEEPGLQSELADAQAAVRSRRSLLDEVVSFGRGIISTGGAQGPEDLRRAFSGLEESHPLREPGLSMLEQGAFPGFEAVETGRGKTGVRAQTGKATPDLLTGDEARATFERGGGVAAGDGGSGGRRGPGLRGGGGGGGPFDRLTTGGVVEVIVKNVPLPITFSGAVPGTPQTTAQAGVKTQSNLAQFRADTSKVMQERVQRQIQKLTDEGKSEGQIRRALKEGGLSVTGSVLMDEGGPGGRAGNVRRALGLGPAIESAATRRERDLVDKARAEDASKLRQSERRITKRGFGPSVQDILQNAFGGLDSQVEATSRFQRESAQLRSLQERRAKERGDLGTARENERLARASLAEPGLSKTETGRRQAIVDRAAQERQFAGEEFRGVRTAEREQRGRRTAAAAALPSGADAARNIALGGIASIGSTAISLVPSLFAFQAVSSAIQGVTEVLGPLIERMTGFQNTLGRISGELSQATRASGGFTEAVVAQRGSQAGLTPGQLANVAPGLESITDIRAGGEAFKEAIELFRASRAGGSVNPIGQSVGGPFGLPINAVPSITEQIADEIKTNNEFVAPGSPVAQIFPDLAKISPEDAQKNKDFINFLNAGLKDLGYGTAQFTDNLDESSRALQMKAAADAGASDKLIKDIEQGFGLLENGQPITDPEKLKELFEALRSGKPTPEGALLAQQPQIQAQEALRMGQLAAQRETFGPGARGIAAAAAPMRFGGAEQLGLSGEEASRFAGQLSEIDGLYKSINATATDNRKIAESFVSDTLGSVIGAQFSSELADVAQYGQQIADLQIGIETKQAALAAQQYEYQIRLATRSLTDAKALAGQITASTKDNLGAIQRQNFELSRQLRILQQEQAQRQINFRVSLAGFMVPGMTPEEQAARLAFAKQEAGLAQEQLDIQKKLGTLSDKGFQVGASRAVRDLTEQIELLRAGRDVTLSVSFDQKKMAVLQKAQDGILERVNSTFQTAISRSNDAMAHIAKFGAEFANMTATVASSVVRAFGITGDEVIKLVKRVNAAFADFDYAKFRQSEKDITGKGASGLIGDTLGQTELTVGEAGTEKVAILKNPQTVPIGSFGGMTSPSIGGAPSINISIVIGANTNITEGELDAWAHEIAKRMGKELGQRVALLGFRTS